MKVPHVLQPYIAAGKDFIEDDGPQAAAALSFYAVSALPPLVVFTLGLTGLFYSSDNAADQLADQISQLLGPSVGEVISTIVEQRPETGEGFAMSAGLLVMLISASGFFSQLQNSQPGLGGSDKVRRWNQSNHQESYYQHNGRSGNRLSFSHLSPVVDLDCFGQLLA